MKKSPRTPRPRTSPTPRVADIEILRLVDRFLAGETLHLSDRIKLSEIILAHLRPS